MSPPLTSFVWEHFDKSEEPDEKFKAVCKYCKTKISWTKNVSSNLHKHLKVTPIYT